MSESLRDRILATGDDCFVKEVNVPEWGFPVYVAMLTAGERDRLEYEIQESKAKKSDIRALVASSCLCDEDGRRLFKLTDVESLSRLSGLALDRVFTAALGFNRMTSRDLQELEGNSAAGR